MVDVRWNQTNQTVNALGSCWYWCFYSKQVKDFNYYIIINYFQGKRVPHKIIIQLEIDLEVLFSKIILSV